MSPYRPSACPTLLQKQLYCQIAALQVVKSLLLSLELPYASAYSPNHVSLDMLNTDYLQTTKTVMCAPCLTRTTTCQRIGSCSFSILCQETPRTSGSSQLQFAHSSCIISCPSPLLIVVLPACSQPGKQSSQQPGMFLGARRYKWKTSKLWLICALMLSFSETLSSKDSSWTAA